MKGRIKEVRKALKLSQDEFGRRLGVTRGAITNLELNKVEPKPLFIDLLCREFNVNEDWLRTGEGEMFVPLDREQEIARMTLELLDEEDNSFKYRLIKSLMNLDPSKWDVLEDIAMEIAQKKD